MDNAVGTDHLITLVRLPAMLRSTISLQQTLARFGASAGLSFGLNLGITWFAHHVAGAPPQLAFGLALLTVFPLNFLVLRYYVFRAGAGRAGPQFAKLVGASVAFRCAEYLAFLITLRLWRIPYLVAAVMVLGTSFVIKFVVFRTKVFAIGRPALP